MVLVDLGGADDDVVYGEDGRIVLVNAQTERVFGYSREELLGEAIRAGAFDIDVVLCSDPFAQSPFQVKDAVSMKVIASTGGDPSFAGSSPMR